MPTTGGRLLQVLEVMKGRAALKVLLEEALTPWRRPRGGRRRGGPMALDFDVLSSVKLEGLGMVEPLCAGFVEFPIPPEVGTPTIVHLRYVMYRHAGGLVFDFIKADDPPLSDDVQMYIWIFRGWLQAQLVAHATAFFRDVYTPQQLTLFPDAETLGPPGP